MLVHIFVYFVNIIIIPHILRLSIYIINHKNILFSDFIVIILFEEKNVTYLF